MRHEAKARYPLSFQSWSQGLQTPPLGKLAQSQVLSLNRLKWKVREKTDIIFQSSETSRANSWKHVRPRIFTGFSNKSKFINRSTSPLIFSEESKVESSEPDSLPKDSSAPSVPGDKSRNKDQIENEDNWKLVVNFHLLSSEALVAWNAACCGPCNFRWFIY